MKLLHLDSSILGEASASRRLSKAIVDHIAAVHPGLDVTYHDLEADPRLHLSGKHLAAFAGAPFDSPEFGADISAGGGYIDELFEHDFIVIGVPMYNFAVPSQLKAWIDRVLVAGRTFRYTERGPEGLLPKDKKVFIASARGGAYSGESPIASLDHQESYLLAVLNFIGLADIQIVRAEGLALGEEARLQAIAGAIAQVEALVL